MRDLCRKGFDSEAVLAALSPAELVLVHGEWRLWARDDQLEPEGDWITWLMLGGRGAGKTRAGAEWVRSLATSDDPEGAAERIALIGETMADVRKVMVEGPSGILAAHQDWERPRFEPSLRRLVWPTGAVAELFSPIARTACAGRSSRPPGATRPPSGATPSRPGTCCSSRCGWAPARARW